MPFFWSAISARQLKSDYQRQRSRFSARKAPVAVTAKPSRNNHAGLHLPRKIPHRKTRESSQKWRPYESIRSPHLKISGNRRLAPKGQHARINRQLSTSLFGVPFLCIYLPLPETVGNALSQRFFATA
jgi:hypothetical protein